MQGTSVSDQQLSDVVKCVLREKIFPYTADGAYFIMSSDEILATSGLCTAYCAWHYWDTWNSSGVLLNYKCVLFSNPQHWELKHSFTTNEAFKYLSWPSNVGTGPRQE